MEDLMKHKNLPHLPALAEGGELRGGTKAEILPCLYPDYKPTLSPESPNVTCLVLMGLPSSTIAHLGSQDFPRLFQTMLSSQSS